MAFKSSETYRKDKYGKMLVLPNDQDFVDLVLLYQAATDVLLADVHYIKSDDYSGYVHCLGRGCPACNHVTPNGNKGIRIQPKLFIPLYNVTTNEVNFFDRSIKFESQLQTEVFSKFPNPSDFVFRLTRHGVAGDMDTKYAFVAVGNNVVKSYDEICAEFNITFPDYYENVCRDVDAATMLKWLSNASSGSGVVSSGGAMVDYTVTPRGGPSVGTPPAAGGVHDVPPPDFSGNEDEGDEGENPEF